MLTDGRVQNTCLFPEQADDRFWYVYDDTWAVVTRTYSTEIPPVADEIRSATGGKLHEFTCGEWEARVRLLNEKEGDFPWETPWEEYVFALLAEPGADLSVLEP